MVRVDSLGMTVQFLESVANTLAHCAGATHCRFTAYV